MQTRFAADLYAVSCCSALTVLASSSGVTAERQAFMDLVKHEIDRINKQAAGKGSLSMVFKSGGITVGAHSPPVA